MPSWGLARGLRCSLSVVSAEAYSERYAESLRDPSGFWMREAEALSWFHRPSSTLDVDPEGADVAWFSGGRLNAAVNCVDRHAATRPGKTALLWVKDEPGEYERISYGVLKHRVGQLANALLANGVRRGDRVAIYLPNVPEAVYAMLACARVGAVHVVVFSGFSAEALRDRVVDCGAKLVVTANEGVRGARHIPLKARVDEALGGVTHVERVLVARRTAKPVAMRPGRDLFLEEEMARQRSIAPAAWMSSEDPLFISYTSGGSAEPKGVLHTTAGYLLYVSRTQAEVFGSELDDVHMCPSNVGCITGHSYVVYGPLVNGLSTVIFESTPTYPSPDRYWRVVEDLGVHTLFASPSALRQLEREDERWVRERDLSSLRRLGVLSEPMSASTWTWYRELVGEGQRPVIETWWHTEAGGILLHSDPEASPQEPSGALIPFAGIQPALLGPDGEVVGDEAGAGELCLARSWPGQARTLFGDHRRFRETFFGRHPGVFATGDHAVRDARGFYRITGRGDAFLNVSGYRLGAAEIEGALLAHEAVAETAVVPVSTQVEGQSICAYVILRPDGGAWVPEELVGALKEQVRHAIGPIATPDSIRIVDELPRTRSGRVDRHTLRRLAEAQPPPQLERRKEVL